MNDIQAYDTETTGLFWSLGDKMFSYSICDEAGKSEVHRLDTSQIRTEVGLQRLNKFWEDVTITKLMHNAKFDMQMTLDVIDNKKAVMEASFHDTLVMSKLLIHRTGYGLKALTHAMFNYPTDDEVEVKRYAKGRGYHAVPEAIMHKYQVRDVERTMLLYLALKPKLDEDPVVRDIYQMELELIRHTIHSERRGVSYDKAKARRMLKKALEELETIEIELHKECGREVNVASSKDMQWLLFEQQELTPIKKTKKSGNPATDLETLNFYRLQGNKVADMIMHARALRYTKSTIESYEKFLAPTGRIHPSINTMQAITGRESCSNPNLQNVSKDTSGKNPYAFPARSIFLVREGYVNIHIDFASIEIRLIANCSGDNALIDIINEGGDPHYRAMEIFYGEMMDYVDEENLKMLRNAGKQGQYAVAYGASAKKLGVVLGLSTAEAGAGLKRYKKEFPGVAAFSKKCMHEAKENGCIRSELGRVIFCESSQAYKAPNRKIQGTAADILKHAYVRVAEYLADSTEGEASIILPIHDELLIEWPRTRLVSLNYSLRNIERLMTYFENLIVPMNIDVSLTTSYWRDAKPYLEWSAPIGV